MDYFKNNFQDRPEDLPQDLPTGFEWENMAEGIEAKMKKNAVRPARRWWSLFLLLLISGCGTYIVFSWSDPTETKQSLSAEEVVLAYPNTNAAESSVQSTKEQAAFSKDVVSSSKEGNSLNFNDVQNDPLPAVGVSTFEPALEKAQPVRTSDVSFGGHLRQQKNNSTSEVLPARENKTELNAPTPRNTADAVALAMIPTRDFSLLTIDTSDLQVKQNSKPFVKPIPSTINIALLGGPNYWTNSAGQRNASYIEGFPSWSIRPEVSWNKQKWSVYVAYQYDRIEEKFAYQGSTALPELVEDVVIGEVINSYSGEVIEQKRKDTTLLVHYMQRELKYNQYNFHRLELGVGRTIWESSNHRVSAIVGAAYFVDFNGSGKRLNERNLVSEFAIEKKDNGRSLLALNVGMEYEYRFAAKTSLLLRANGMQHLNEIRISQEEQIRPFVYGLQIGLRTSF